MSVKKTILWVDRRPRSRSRRMDRVTRMARLTQLEKEILACMLTSHAYRERLAADLFVTALDMAPTPEGKNYILHVIEEEQQHYSKCLEVAAELGIDLEPLVAARMVKSPPGIPPFHKWLDVILAHALNDQAGLFVLEGIINSKVIPYAKLAAEIVAEEKSHGACGKTLLLEYYPRAKHDINTKKDMLITHLDAAVRCLGRPNSPYDAEALRSGLKTRSSIQAIRAFCAYADNIVVDLDCIDMTPLSTRYLQ